MARAPRPVLILGTFVVFALALGGCRAGGGGYMPSGHFEDDQQSTTGYVGAKKATFGFTWLLVETGQPGSELDLGQGSWSDGYVKFRIAGGFLSGTDGQACRFGQSDYTSTNKSYPGGGTAYITICDEGEPGPTNGDSLTIRLDGTAYDGYTNSGTLSEGNLQVKG